MKLKTKYGTIEATIEPNTKAVMVSVSGGMDSATLLYMLCKQIRDNKLGIPVYTGTVSYNYDRAAHYNASLVVKHMQREFPDITIHAKFWAGEDFVGKVKTPLVETMYSDIRLKNGWTQQEFKLWWGLTANPQGDSFKFVDPDGSYVTPRDADHSNEKTLYGKGFCNPFALIDKRVIVAAQLEYGLFECFRTITNSCTSIKEYECQQCWWCQERRWAIEQVVPEELKVPDDSQPLPYFQERGVKPEWRAGVRWNEQAYQERLSMTAKHPLEEDTIEWAKRYIEGQYDDVGVNRFKLGKGNISFDTATRLFTANPEGAEQVVCKEMHQCLALFSDVDIIDCARKLRLLHETYHEK